MHIAISDSSNAAVSSCAPIVTSRSSPFWALPMLSEQYALAMDHIDRLKSRIELADARILELSQELDAMSPGERSPNKPSTDT